MPLSLSIGTMHITTIRHRWRIFARIRRVIQCLDRISCNFQLAHFISLPRQLPTQRHCVNSDSLERLVNAAIRALHQRAQVDLGRTSCVWTDCYRIDYFKRRILAASKTLIHCRSELAHSLDGIKHTP
jgi:hypothetical protein